MTFTLESKAFLHNGDIPDRYGCNGKGISPPLSWSDIPKQTKSFAIIMLDLDTPIKHISHWVLYNIPHDKADLPEFLPSSETFQTGMVQGRNSMRKNQYMPPCPPFGKHRYVFTIYALDTMLEQDPKMNKRKLFNAINGHILAESELHGFYSKK